MIGFGSGSKRYGLWKEGESVLLLHGRCRDKTRRSGWRLLFLSYGAQDFAFSLIYFDILKSREIRDYSS